MKYMTEKEKMLAGEIYSAVDIQLLDELAAAREMIHDYNLLRPSENGKKLELLKGLLGYIADDAIIINQPFYCDYGKPRSAMHLSMIPKSRPLCFAGDFRRRSTFSNNANAGLFSWRMSRICHQRIPFFPSIPFSLEREWATE